MICKEILDVLLEYDPEIGEFYWTENAHYKVKGKLAGWEMYNGYKWYRGDCVC